MRRSEHYRFAPRERACADPQPASSEVVPSRHPRGRSAMLALTRLREHARRRERCAGEIPTAARDARGAGMSTLDVDHVIVGADLRRARRPRPTRPRRLPQRRGDAHARTARASRRSPPPLPRAAQLGSPHCRRCQSPRPADPSPAQPRSDRARGRQPARRAGRSYPNHPTPMWPALADATPPQHPSTDATPTVTEPARRNLSAMRNCTCVLVPSHRLRGLRWPTTKNSPIGPASYSPTR